MQKRIALAAGLTAPDAAACAQAQARELTFTPVAPGEALPAATVAALGAQCDAALIDLAAGVGARHDELLYLLAEAIDCREGFLAGSSRRVQEHASRLAEVLKLNEEDRLALERAALVRDIGKLKIPNDVLLKREVFTYDEWRLMQEHTRMGGDLLEQTEGLRDAALVVRQHHECWDGTGYPEGLEGEAIAPLARALKILDVYCAMTSPRHYRKGSSTHEQAVNHLRQERGKHFDPALIDAFLDGDVGGGQVQ